MKIEFSKIVEGIGVISLVISLLFVGFEVRQNTNVARSDAYQNFNLEAANHQLGVATDERLSEALAKLSSGGSLGDLSDGERMAVSYYYNSVVRIWAGIFYAAQEGVVPNSAIEGAGLGGVFANPNFRTVWDIGKQQYDAAFIEFIEAQIERASQLSL